MQLYTTANIQISDDKLTTAIVPKLRKIQNELNEALEAAANAVLERHCINNDEVHTVIVDEIVSE